MHPRARRLLQRSLDRAERQASDIGAIRTGDPLAARFASFGQRSVIEWPRVRLDNPGGMAFGDDVHVRSHLAAEAWCPPGAVVLALGSRLHLGHGVRFVALNGITVGDDCALGHGATISDTIHDWKNAEPGQATWQAPLKAGRPLAIEAGAWVGNGCVLTGGITVGARAIVGPNTVLSRDVPADAIVAGSPARVQRVRRADGSWRWLVDPATLDLAAQAELARRGDEPAVPAVPA